MAAEFGHEHQRQHLHQRLPGQRTGRLYGRGYKRAPEGAFYTDAQGRNISCAGQVIVDQASGAPVLTGTEDPLLDLGSIYPDWKAGMTHTFSYRNLKMALTFTGQWGGNAYSVTHFALAYQGKLKNSLPGRYAGLVHEGVNLNTDGTYQKNATITRDIADYYSTYVYARENAENNTFDTSFLKLKELRIEYALPSKICRKTKFIRGLRWPSTPPTSSAGPISRSTIRKPATWWVPPSAGVLKPEPIP